MHIGCSFIINNFAMFGGAVHQLPPSVINFDLIAPEP
jgi:hypothetical protein